MYNTVIPNISKQYKVMTIYCIDEETNEIYYWCTLPTEYLNAIIKRKNWKFENINEQSGFGLYEQIKSQKHQNNKKI